MRHRKLRWGERDPSAALLPEVEAVARPSPAALQLSDEVKAEIDAIRAEETLALARSGARTAAIMEALGVPQGLEGAELDEWCTHKLSHLRVLSLAVQEYALRYGTKAEMKEASKTILAITEKEKQNFGAAPIIFINNGQGGAAPPWRTSAAIVEVQNGATVDDVVALPTSVAGRPEDG